MGKELYVTYFNDDYICDGFDLENALVLNGGIVTDSAIIKNLDLDKTYKNTEFFYIIDEEIGICEVDGNIKDVLEELPGNMRITSFSLV